MVSSKKNTWNKLHYPNPYHFSFRQLKGGELKISEAKALLYNEIDFEISHPPMEGFEMTICLYFEH